ncbi:MAG: PHB depolymerase family esterase [Deltaproteobacteria bacterium]
MQQVTDFDASGLPSDVSMSIYVPDAVADYPPVLVLSHYCGGTAPAVFGQARGGGIVSAADRYGFIIVVPSSGRCWDVVSNRARTRDGGGDSHAIRQMVRHATDRYAANAERVYATGDSSGGMMTELLLALYPDVFKAGAAFAGMPAGCRGAMESGAGGGYSGACAGGSVSHSPQEWGDIARAMHPEYMGHRPRVQLFHGDGDTTIRYPNHTEAVKQWTDVLGLVPAPTMTADDLSLGDHRATRQTWQNACGHPVLDAFTSLGGDHGPSDALFVAQYVIPFLGLDVIGAVDPEVERCGAAEPVGGAGGTGGAGDSSGGPIPVGDARGVTEVGGNGMPNGTSTAGQVPLSAAGPNGDSLVAAMGESATEGSAPGAGPAGEAAGQMSAAAGSNPASAAKSSGCSVVGASSKNEPALGALGATALALLLGSRRRRLAGSAR